MARPPAVPGRLNGALPARQLHPYSVRGIEILGLVLGATLIALVVGSADVEVVLLGAAAFLLFLIAFLMPEVSLYVLVFSMLLSPEFIVGSTGGAAAMGRGVTLRLEDFLIILIGVAWLSRLAVYKELGLLRSTPLNLPIFAYILVCAISTSLGVIAGRVEPLTGFMFVFKYFEFVVIYFMVVNYVRDREQVRKLLFAVLVTATIIAFIAFLQIPTGARVTAPFEGETGEPNTLGGYLVLVLAIALGLLSEASRVGARIGLGGLALFLLIPIAYTMSRTSWLALIAMLVTVVLVSRQKLLFLGLASAGMIFLLLAMPEQISERLAFTVAERAQATSVEVFGIVLEPSASARLVAWIDLAQDIPKHPLLGHGVTGYTFLDAQYPRTILETGLLGFATLLWILWTVFRTGRTLYDTSDDPIERALGLGLVAGLVGVMVHGLGANTFIIVRIMEPFWLLVGLAVVSLLLEDEEEEAPLPEGESDLVAAQ
jgi:hypothetical protein